MSVPHSIHAKVHTPEGHAYEFATVLRDAFTYDQLLELERFFQWLRNCVSPSSLTVEIAPQGASK